MTMTSLDYLDWTVRLLGAAGFIALLSGCLLVGLCLLRTEVPPSNPGKEPGGEDRAMTGGDWRACAIAVVGGGSLLFFLCLWWGARLVTHSGRSDSPLPLAAATEPWAVNLFPWK